MCSFLSRIPSEEHTREGADSEAHDDAPRLNVDRPVGYQLHGIGGSDAQAHANESAGYAEQDCLDEELAEDVYATGRVTTKSFID